VKRFAHCEREFGDSERLHVQANLRRIVGGKTTEFSIASENFEWPAAPIVRTAR
jgi:hypothetical protein